MQNTLGIIVVSWGVQIMLNTEIDDVVSKISKMESQDESGVVYCVEDMIADIKSYHEKHNNLSHIHRNTLNLIKAWIGLSGTGQRGN